MGVSLWVCKITFSLKRLFLISFFPLSLFLFLSLCLCLCLSLCVHLHVSACEGLKRASDLLEQEPNLQLWEDISMVIWKADCTLGGTVPCQCFITFSDWKRKDDIPESYILCLLSKAPSSRRQGGMGCSFILHLFSQVFNSLFSVT